jgi:hypothetical protein
MFRFTRTLVAAAVMWAAGCTGGTTDVAGTVTYNGKPVPHGTVVIVGADGLSRSGAIQHDGSYRVKDVPVGAARVAVSSPRPPGSAPSARQPVEGGADKDRPLPEPPPSAPAEGSQNWISIPERYGDPKTSGLSLIVKPGQPADLKLE